MSNSWNFRSVVCGKLLWSQNQDLAPNFTATFLIFSESVETTISSNTFDFIACLMVIPIKGTPLIFFKALLTIPLELP